MKKTLYFLLDYLRSVLLTDKEKTDILPAINHRNMQNLKVGSILMIVISVFHILVFYNDLRTAQGTDLLWIELITYSHMVFLAYFLMTLLYAFFHKSGNWLKKISPRFIFNFTFFFLLMMGAAIASFDQLTMSSITPLVIVSVASPLIFYISPLISWVYFGVSFLFFAYLSQIYQANTDIQISLIVNSLTIVAVGYFLNLSSWIGGLNRLRQINLINEQQKQMEKKNNELLVLTNELKQTNSLKDKFFSIIAHDLRNPFNVLISSSEMLLDESADYSKDEQDILKTNIRKTSKNTYLLLQNLLEWSQLQRKKITLNRITVSISQLIENSVLDFKFSLLEKNISLVKKLSNIEISLDQVLIESVIRNLLSNAIKFTPKDGTITIETFIYENQLWINFTDTGIGMSEELRSKLFTSLNEAGRPGTEGEKSAGLGLQLCKEFIELHKGELRVESKENQGSTFSVILPMVS